MDEFVKMRKGDQVIEVHQLVVNAHIALGWAVVEEEPVIEPPSPVKETPAPVPAARKSKKGA